MSNIPKNTSLVSGVYTALRTGRGGNAVGGTNKFEDRLIAKEEDAVNTGTNGRIKMEMCERYDLPKGVTCLLRRKEQGLMFCGGPKEGCPLKK